jgi:dihydropteroate synthase
VSLDEELRRVIPVVEQLTGLDVSVDTAKAEVARRALAAGAVMINDVTALRGDPDLVGVIALGDAFLCLMHMQGTPRTMQDAPRYGDVVAEVAAFLEERLAFAVAEGVSEERICLDPGIGFGKTPDQNLALVRGLRSLVALGRPILVGLSRKSTLARITRGPEARVASDAASVAGAVLAFAHGATLFRAHDARSHAEALAVAAAIERGTVDG